MNAPERTTTERHAVLDVQSNGRVIDLSQRAFINRLSALGFAAKMIDGREQFIRHDGRIIVSPVMTHLGTVDRYHTLRRIEEAIEVHAQKSRAANIALVLIGIVAFVLAVLFIPAAKAETRTAVLERAYADTVAAAPSCLIDYSLQPGETSTVTCLRSCCADLIEHVRSGNGRVLISVARKLAKPPGVVVTLHNPTVNQQAGTATVEFF